LESLTDCLDGLETRVFQGVFRHRLLEGFTKRLRLVLARILAA
jgi:hypothetical protein